MVSGGFVAENWLMVSPNDWEIFDDCLPYITIIWENKDGSQHKRCHILEILLDPEGLRAAYGEKADDHQVEMVDCKDPIIFNLGLTPFWKVTAQHILNAWLSSSGDAEKTISCAYDLLPK